MDDDEEYYDSIVGSFYSKSNPKQAATYIFADPIKYDKRRKDRNIPDSVVTETYIPYSAELHSANVHEIGEDSFECPELHKSVSSNLIYIKPNNNQVYWVRSSKDYTG